MTTLNPTRTNTYPRMVGIAFIGAAVIALGVAAAIVRPFDSTPTTSTSSSNYPLAPSAAVAQLTVSEQLSADMAFHEALTVAEFGLVVTERDVAAEIVAAIAQHEALMEPFMIFHGSQVAPPRDDSAEIAAAIAEHEALIQPFVS